MQPDHLRRDPGRRVRAAAAALAALLCAAALGPALAAPPAHRGPADNRPGRPFVPPGADSRRPANPFGQSPFASPFRQRSGAPPRWDGQPGTSPARQPMPQDNRLPQSRPSSIGPSEAARRAQSMNGGGRVLTVTRDDGGYRVKLIKRGEVRVVFVPGG